jgi:hypothetical protein
MHYQVIIAQKICTFTLDKTLKRFYNYYCKFKSLNYFIGGAVMLKLGSINNNKQQAQKKTINWSEFKKQAKAGKYLITYLFGTGRIYEGRVIQNAGIIFEGEDLKVKMSISQEQWQSVKQVLNLSANDIIGKEFYFVIQEDGTFGVEAWTYEDEHMQAIYEFDKVKKMFKLVYKPKQALQDDEVVDF